MANVAVGWICVVVFTLFDGSFGVWWYQVAGLASLKAK
ncbi:hypothetical protein JOF29_002230 [Kribbella aluminosa]|uniref:Uncharacterized protein n=1 Tax=Kribbella aluminosa TaxID=416017 RepID=A0ABS4UHL9_9ACTN|nr:hypothetical protein [Kribbella aluminosa]